MPGYYDSFKCNYETQTPIVRIFIDMMNKGVMFTKCGRKGSPHARLMKTNRPPLGNENISDSNLINALVNLEDSQMMWYSGGKIKSKSYVWFRSIKRIMLGQKTANFKRHTKKLGSKDHLSFSIIYTEMNKNVEKEMSLDLVAPSRDEFDLFLFGVKMIWRAIKTGRLEAMGVLTEHLTHSFRAGPILEELCQKCNVAKKQVFDKECQLYLCFSCFNYTHLTNTSHSRNPI